MDLGTIDQTINNSSLYMMWVVGLLVTMIGVQIGEMSKMFSVRSVPRRYKRVVSFSCKEITFPNGLGRFNLKCEMS
jgi:hypothetical protein